YSGVLKQEGGGAASLLLVGHNPAIQETALRLAESLASKDGRRLKESFPPAALAIFDLAGGWRDLAPGTARLAAVIIP
ncbi:MAG TPA: histidine phosphatase family protein, partial [Propylenella sp.]|nr:histidine phosphatase family protein [Propylenella sp.]